LTYLIRPMRPEDISQVNEIDRQAFDPRFPSPDYRQELKNKLAAYIVICDGNKTPDNHHNGVMTRLARLLSGFASRREHHQPGAPPPAAPPSYIAGFAGIWVLADEGHLTAIIVRKEYRRRGLGELLLTAALEKARERGARTLTLEVRVSNTAAQSLYRKYGFREVGRRPKYYTDNREDALLMTSEDLDSASFQRRLRELKRARREKTAVITA